MIRAREKHARQLRKQEMQERHREELEKADRHATNEREKRARERQEVEQKTNSSHQSSLLALRGAGDSGETKAQIEREDEREDREHEEKYKREILERDRKLCCRGLETVEFAN